MGKTGAIAAEMATQALSAKAAAIAKTAAPGGRPGPPSPVRTVVPGVVLEHASVPADNLTAVEASIVRQVFERRIRVSELFADFDPLRRGIITRAQFLRGLRGLRLEGISPSGMEAVAEKYSVGVRAASQGRRRGPSPSPPPPSFPLLLLLLLQAPEMEASMRLPSGLAPEAETDLTTEERAELLRERARGTRDTLRQAVASQLASAAPPAGAFVRWRDFVADVDAAWTEPGLEKDPLKGLESFARTVATAPHPRFVRPELPAAEQVRGGRRERTFLLGHGSPLSPTLARPT